MPDLQRVATLVQRAQDRVGGAARGDAMIGAVISGVLISDPVERCTREGKPFMTAAVRCPAGDDALLIGVAAFSETAAARLAQMHKGGAVAACGVLEVSAWTTRDGEARSGWRLTASEVLTAYAATKRRRQAEGSDDDGR